MKTFDYVITDEVGIHARPATLLAKKAKEMSATITLVNKDGKSVEAKKLMAVMGLGIKKGETVTVNVEGENEDAVAAEMETFFKENL